MQSVYTTVEVNENFTIVYADDIPLAVISYNDSDISSYITHPWVVMIAGNEIHNCSTWQQAYSYITWHHKQNTLLDKPFDELTHTEWQELKIGKPEDQQNQTEINSAQVNDNTTIVYTGEIPIACITYQGSNFAQPYTIKIAEEEIHRAKTWAECFSYIINSRHSSTNNKPENNTLQIETTLEQTEVDSLSDQDFGILCRLWHNTTLLGTFYRRQIFTDNWIATPTDSLHPYHCQSEDDARYWLVAHHLQHSTPKPNTPLLIAKSLVCAGLTLLLLLPQFSYAAQTRDRNYADQAPTTTDNTYRGSSRRELK